ncbi:MAG TPA: hypothetical protein VMH87_11980 [Pseudomonadales bacterium]|nr:hypothetical protein [Pseudomonadales bacterium]
MNETLLKFNRLKGVSLAVGILGLMGCCAGFIFERQAFYISYLIAFLFWLSLSLGCFYAAMIHYLTGGRWGFPARRFLEAGFMTLPLMAVFFAPILFGLHELYPWARPETVAADKILQQRAAFENPPAFIVRALVCFAIWTFIAWRLRQWSLQQDASADAAPTLKIRALSGPAIGIVPLTASFAFVDWAMSIEPDWSSTVFPVIILSSQILMAIAFAIIMLAWTQNESSFRSFGQKPFHDLGNLLLAFVMFWTYVAFSQILIIYSANLPEEIGWYLRRNANGWIWLAGFIALFLFLVPFFLLLFRRVKKNIRLLTAIAFVILIVQATEMFWAIAPTFYPHIHVHWMDFISWFGLGGIWLSVFLRNLSKHPLLALKDPRLENLNTETVHAK